MSKGKKKIIWIIIIVVLAVGGYLMFGGKKAGVEYTTVDARKGDLGQTVSITGEVVAPEQTELSFKLNERISSIAVNVGDKVKKGQELAELDKSNLYFQISQARKDIDYQTKVWEGMRRNKMSYNGAQREGQRILIHKAETNYQDALNSLKDAVLVSPIDGTVIRRNKEVGELSGVGSPVLTVAGEGELEIEADVPESDILKIQEGQMADVALDAILSDEKIRAELFEVEPASTVIQDVVYYKVRLKMFAPDKRLKVGMSADVDILTDEVKDTVFVPLRAIRDEGNGKFVEILVDQETNQIRRVEVRTGLEGDDGMVEIKEGSLKGGEKVITFTKKL